MDAGILTPATFLPFVLTDREKIYLFGGEGSARATDQVFVAVFCEAENAWVTSDEGSQRNAGSYTLDVAEFNGKAVHGYIGFLSADGKFVSTSLYTGLVNIL